MQRQEQSQSSTYSPVTMPYSDFAAAFDGPSQHVGEMMSYRLVWTVTLLGLSALLFAGCQPSESAYPDGAVTLRQNIPTPHDDYTLIGYNMSGEEAVVSVAPAGDLAVPTTVTKGESYAAAGLQFTVVDVVEDETAANGNPGSADGFIVITVP